MPNVKETNTKKDSFTVEEIKVIEKHYKNIPFGDIVYTLINTGLRSQEICAINDKSMITDDAGQRYILVDKAMKRTRVGGWELGETKTDKSDRMIPIDGEIYTLLMQRIVANKDHLLLPGRDQGNNISYDNFKKHYYRFFEVLSVVSKEKIRALPPHCCRHTYNSRLIWAGVSPFVIQSLMGHTNMDMTENYAHIMKEQKVEAVKKIKIV